MNRYEGLTCPVCHAKLFEDDDIVVCPECGAPHHRDCWKYIGHCAYSDAHGTPMQWTMPKVDPDDAPEENNEQEKESADKSNPSENGKPLGYKSGVFPNVEIIEPDPNEDPEVVRKKVADRMLDAAGIMYTDKTDGESSEEIAMFVGFNAVRYIKKFKAMVGKKIAAGWNWLAFFIPQYWFLARKCYGIGSILCAYDLFTTVMITLMQGENYQLYDKIAQSAGNPAIVFTDPTLISCFVLGLISIVIRIFCGIFGDCIYRGHTFKTLKKIRDDERSGNTDDDLSHDARVIKAGGVNLWVPITVYFFIDFVAAIIVSII